MANTALAYSCTVKNTIVTRLSSYNKSLTMLAILTWITAVTTHKL